MSRVAIPVLPGPKEFGWPEHTEGTAAVYISAAKAFATSYPSDAHFAAYSVPSIARRLATDAAIERLAPAGGIPIVLLVIDLDAANHGDGIDVGAWFESERPKLAALEDAHPGGFWYRTRGGYRLAYHLAEPVVLRTIEDKDAWRTRYQRTALYLARSFDLLADPACGDWTRLFRLPHVTRDGERQHLETSGDPSTIGAWSYVPSDAALEADITTARELGATSPLWSTVARRLAGQTGEPAVARSLAAPALRPRTGGRPTLEERERLWCEKALASESNKVRSAGKGTRNNTLNAAALVLGHYVGSGLLGENDTRAVLLAAALEAGTPKPEARATISSGLGKGKREPRRPELHADELPRSWRATRDASGRLVTDDGEVLPEEAPPGSTASEPSARSTEQPQIDGEQLQDDGNDATGPTSGERRQAAQRREAGDRRALRVLDPWAFRTTDTGNSERLVARHGLDLRYCDPWKKWLVWTGQRWTVDEKGAVRRRAKETARSIYAEASAVKSRKPGNEEHDKRAEERRKGLAAWAVKTEARDRREAMMFLAQSEEPLPVIAAELDTNIWLFNIQNGTLDLRTGELRPHRREDLLTKLAPVTYDPAARCPTWLTFLARVFGGDDELVAFVQRFAGFCLTGSTRDHVLLTCWGTGSNGKSTLLETLLAMMGDYGWQAPPDLLLAKANDAHPTDRAHLFGVRLAVCMETPAGRRLDEALMKSLTGGDTITARRMREDPWSFAPTHKLVIGTNHKPTLSTTDHGTWRRQKLVPFAVTIPDEEQDKLLAEKLRAELPGILRWAVEGCLAWQREGLGTPAQVREATKGWRDESDVLGPFLAECCELGRGLEAKAADLFAAYSHHSQVSGEEPLKQKTFGMRLTERGLVQGKSGSTRRWRGIRLLTPLEQRDRAQGEARGGVGTDGTDGTDGSGMNSLPDLPRGEIPDPSVPSVPSVPSHDGPIRATPPQTPINRSDGQDRFNA